MKVSVFALTEDCISTVGGGFKMPGGGNGGEALIGVAAGITNGAEIGVSCIAAGAWTRVAGTFAYA